MPQPIGGQDSRRGFSDRHKNTCLGPQKEHLYQVWSKLLQPFLRRSRKCLSQLEARAAILDFPIRTKSNHNCSGPHKEHLYQVRSQSLQPIPRRSRKCLGQSEARASISDFRIGTKNNNTWLGKS